MANKTYTGGETFVIRKAEKKQSLARIGLSAPAGGGKTYSALVIARSLVAAYKTLGVELKIGYIDTENASSEKYADEFDFDILPLRPPYEPKRYTAAIKYLQANGYGIIVIDSLSHAWAGSGGALETVDNITANSKSGNKYAAWRTVTPDHNKLVDTMVMSTAHIIACMRAKTEYSQEKDDYGKTVIRKLGLAPIQREGMDYEFDLVFELDPLDNAASVSKTRCRAMRGKTFRPITSETAAIIFNWLTAGKVAEPEPEAVQPSAPIAQATRSQKELLTWATDTYAMNGAQVRDALVTVGITAFDPSRWDEMQDAISNAAMAREMQA